MGASGYAGRELVRLLARHRGVTLTLATGSQAGSASRRLPGLARIWDGEIRPLAIDDVRREADVAFLALPEASSATIGPELLESGLRVVDLSGAFRLRSEPARARWYPGTTAWPDGIAYGLTEFERASIRTSRLVANPGCYPTAALIAVKPLVDAGLIEASSDVVIDAKSGISGAGKGATDRTHFSENHGSVAAYGPFTHRHAPEMEQAIDRGVTFVPHLVPLDRGILVSCYARLSAGARAAQVDDAFGTAYGSEPFVRITGSDLPEIKQVAWTNFCDVGWRLDDEGRRVLVVAVIDNLLKGAAGSAVQNFNVMCGLDEREGLS